MTLIHVKVRHCKWSASRFVHDESANGPLTFSCVKDLARQKLGNAYGQQLRWSWIDGDRDEIKMLSEVRTTAVAAEATWRQFAVFLVCVLLTKHAG